MKKLLLLFIVIHIFLFLPKLDYGQAPDLGAASTFALFTAVGAFNNVGTTMITGDVGTDIGAFNGFPPGIIDGQIYVGDSVSALVSAAVVSAYSSLSGVSCTAALDATLGEGEILLPNVYCMGGAETLNGNLILDGGGDPNSLFIFKINGAFATGTYSKIILIDSASACNVYWQVNGAFALGDNSIFKGTILVSGAVSLLQNSAIIGRCFSSVGAISTFYNVITTCLQSTPLPIELLAFTARSKDADVQLDWSTASETNNNYFTVQRSHDGISFEEILRVAGAGNSTRVLNYSATDSSPYNGTSYYRLQQTDFDGRFSYSNLELVHCEKSFEVNIDPNPFSSSTTITINGASQTTEIELRIYSVIGVEVMNRMITKQSTTLGMSNLPSGIYFYKMISNGQPIQSGTLILQ